MKLNRRDFIMGFLALGGAAAVGGLAGCSAPKQTPSDQGAMPDTGAEKGIPEIFTDGKWIGTAMGHDDELIAEVVVANGDLASIRVLRCDDTIGIGTTAAPMMAARILEAKNLDVDVVSGATTTSIAVRNAVSDAIMNAGGDLATFSLGAAEPRRQGPTKPSRWMLRLRGSAPRDSSPPSVSWKPASRSSSSRSRTSRAARCR